METLYFEDFPLGEVVEYGEAEVAAETIVAFARELDPQPFHLDEEAARAILAAGSSSRRGAVTKARLSRRALLIARKPAMGVDLNRLVSQYLTPQRVGQIASTAGVDPDAAQKLISGAVAVALASLAAAGGAQKLSDAVSNADPDLLNKLSDALGAGQLQTLNDGATALGALVGADRLSGLANALGTHAGIPPEAAQSALGAVGQAVIGVIGQQDPSTWSDASAIAKLIAEQKDAAMAAMPAGLSSLLAGAGVLAGGAATAAAPTAATPAPPASSAPPASGSGLPIWAIVLIIVLVLLGAVYWWYSHRAAEKPAATLAPATNELAMKRFDSRLA